jgi:Ca2+-binding RTX toxin-like protein
MVIEHYTDATRSGIRVRQLSLFDPTISTTSAACTQNVLFNDVICSGSVTGILINSGSASDEIVVGGSNVACEATTGTPITLVLNPGNDIVRPSSACGGQASAAGVNRLHPQFRLQGMAGRDDLTGGRLDDEILGLSDADNLVGGAGNDTLDGGGADDRLSGSSGNDTLIGGSGADVIDGREGSDTVSYASTAAVNVTLDGLANDGAPDERDNVLNVETVLGSAAADVLRGGAAAATLAGGAGNDDIAGGTGADSLRGETGDDVIDARDGVADSVSCGSGSDGVIADLLDVIVSSPRSLLIAKDSGCERVARFAVDDGPPGYPTARRIVVARNGLVTVPVFCPRNARVRCSGTIRLVEAARGKRTLASARYAMGRGATTRVSLSLSAGAAARMRKQRVVTAVTREQGVSRKGPRSATRVLAVG